MKKYKLIETDSIAHDGHTLYRIEALLDLPNGVKKGEKGGYVASEANLLHTGRAWVADSAKVFEQAVVGEDATVEENACIHGDARISGSCTVSGHANVAGDAFVAGRAEITHDARIAGQAMVLGHVYVRGNALLEGDVHVNHHECFGNYAEVQTNADYLLMGPFAHQYGLLTAYRTAASGVGVSFGTFSGTTDAFLDMIYREHGNDTLSKVFQTTIRYIQDVFNIKGGRNT